MAQIREELVLYDRFTNTFTSYIRQAEQAAEATDAVKDGAAQVSTGMSRMASAATGGAAALQRSDRASRSFKSGADSLTGSVQRLAAQLLTLQAVRGLAGLADNLTSINARLNMMNDGLQTTAQLQQMIMDSANRTGGAYQDTADLVGRLGVLASNAFSSTAETVAFAEQVNKLMAIAGTSTEGAAAAMLQLTQAMSSGGLRGDELNSRLEQAPTITQTIADYLGVTIGELRNMASEGQITADVVKTALLSAAEETNAKFEQIPMTLGRIGNLAANAFISRFQPAVERFNDFLASDNGQALISGIAAAASLLGDIVGGVLDALTALADFIANNFDLVMSVAAVAVAVMTGRLLAMAAAGIAANLPLVALIGVIVLLGMVLSNLGVSGSQVLSALGGAFGALGAIAYNAFAIIYNVVATVADFISNVFNNPVAAVAQLFINLADTVLSVLSVIAGGIDILFDVGAQAAVEGLRSKLTGWADDYFNKTNAGLSKTQRLELLNVAETATDTADLFAGVGDYFSGGSGGASGGSTWQDTLDSINANTGATAGSAGSIEKSLGLAEEELKALVDVAERRYVNRINLTAQTPVITINGANTGNTQADRTALANQIRDVLLEQISAGSSTATNHAFSGVT